MRSGGFQMQLSDAMLVAIVPAVGGGIAHAIHFMRSPLEMVYLIAVVSAIPGALIGLTVANMYRMGTFERAWLIWSLAMASMMIGLNVGNH